MKVIDMFEKALVDNGFSQEDARMTMELVAIDGDNKWMTSFWNNQASDFPPELFALIWLSVRKHAAPKVLEMSFHGQSK